MLGRSYFWRQASMNLLSVLEGETFDRPRPPQFRFVRSLGLCCTGSGCSIVLKQAPGEEDEIED